MSIKPACLISSKATIKHLNIRKEGPDEDKVLALDIKLGGCQIGLPLLARLLGAEPVDVGASFWTADGDPRFTGLLPISSWSAIENCHVGLSGVLLHECEVRKFTMELKGKFEIEAGFSVTVKEPPTHAVESLAGLVGEEVRITVMSKQTELELRPPDEPEDAEPAP